MSAEEEKDTESVDSATADSATADSPTAATGSAGAASADNTRLLPAPPPRLAPRGIRTFTVFRQEDESGVSGEGVVIEGVELATGQCIIHWLYPPPRGGIAIFDSMNDFIKVHIGPHPANKTLITYQDGHQQAFGEDANEQ